MIGGLARATPSSGGGPALHPASLRFLALLGLLTPLFAGISLLVRQAAATPEVVREVIEVSRPIYVPQTIYVTVAVPTVVEVQVPARRDKVSRAAPPAPERVDDPLAVGQPAEAVVEAAEPTEAAETEPTPIVARLAPRPVPYYVPRPQPTAVPQEVEAEPVDEPLASAPAEVAPAEEQVGADSLPSSDGPTLAARQALTDFYAFTERNWSVHGYSSAQEMRAALGNNQSNWLDQAQALAKVPSDETPTAGAPGEASSPGESVPPAAEPAKPAKRSRRP